MKSSSSAKHARVPIVGSCVWCDAGVGCWVGCDPQSGMVSGT